VEFIKIWNVILRRKWLFFTNFIVFFVVAVLFSHIYPSLYKGKSLVWVDTGSSTSSLMTKIGVQTSTQATGSTSSDNKYYTEIAMATVRPILSNLVKELDLKGNDGKPLDPDKLVENKYTYYLSSTPHIEVKQYEDSALLEVAAYSRDPEKAAKMSTALSKLYIQEERNRLINEYKSTHPFISPLIDDVKRGYNDTLLELQDFMVKEKVYDLSIVAQSINTKLYSVKSDYEDNEKAILGYQTSLAEAKDKIKGISALREASNEISRSEEMKSLKLKLNELSLLTAEKSVDFTKEHPDYRKIIAQIDSIRKLIKAGPELITNLKTYQIDPAYDDLYKSMFTNAINLEIGYAKRKLLKHYIDKYQNDVVGLARKGMQSQKINLELSVRKDSYSTLLKYLIDVKTAEALALSNIKLVESAVKPTKAKFPNKKLIYALGFIFAGFWSLLVTLFMEYIDDSIKTPADLKRMCNLLLLGTVPKSKDMKAQLMKPKHLPDLLAVEAFRSIKNNIKYLTVDNPFKTILVTSSVAGEGKSSSAISLASIVSLEYNKVLLLDLDLRKPTLHKIFNLNNTVGLTNILADNKTIEESVSKTDNEKLDVLTSGPIPIDPSRLVESKKLKELVTNLQDLYDLVIIDTPPTLAVHDAVEIGTFVDGVICVIQSGKMNAEAINQVETLFNNARVKIIGVILNKVNHYGTGYYHSHYSKYQQ
jgi:capsular exopolysaccharide synthesis family protein